jgi:hypothetical protein
MWMMAPPAAVMCGVDIPLTIGTRSGAKGARPVRTSLPIEITLEHAGSAIRPQFGNIVSCCRRPGPPPKPRWRPSLARGMSQPFSPAPLAVA